jgi:hypothetical protein
LKGEIAGLEAEQNSAEMIEIHPAVQSVEESGEGGESADSHID